MQDIVLQINIIRAESDILLIWKNNSYHCCLGDRPATPTVALVIELIPTEDVL